MKQKHLYEAPLTEFYEINLDSALLQGSVESMNPIEGSWEVPMDKLNLL